MWHRRRRPGQGSAWQQGQRRQRNTQLHGRLSLETECCRLPTALPADLSSLMNDRGVSLCELVEEVVDEAELMAGVRHSGGRTDE